ncbi:MAG: V-type ATP synthase subunit I [Candidatus Geothermincolia bacterium]
MAIAELKKLELLAPEGCREDLMRALFEAGVVHLEDLPGQLRAEGPGNEVLREFKPDVRSLNLEISRSDFLLDFMERFGGPRETKLGGLIPERIHVSAQEWASLRETYDFEALYRHCEDLDVRYKQASAARAEAEKQLERLRPWAAFPAAAESVADSARLVRRVDRLPARQWADFQAEVEESCPASLLARQRRDAGYVYLVAVVAREQASEYAEIAQRFGVEQFRVPEGGTVAARIEEVEALLASKVALQEGLAAAAQLAAEQRERVVVLREFLANELRREDAKGSLAHTAKTIAMAGWVREEQQRAVGRMLEDLSEDIHYEFLPAAAQDKPPTALKNLRGLRKGEVLVRLFGFPHREETDPTPIMAPFFIIFFGLCVSDAGYGVVLVLLCWFIIKKMDLGERANEFLRLFIYCGLASIFAGVLTRGYFGTSAEHLPSWLKFKLSFDTLNAPVSIMAFCAALGFVHIFTGVCIEMWDNARHHSWWDGFCEQGTTLLLWSALLVLVLGYALDVALLRGAGAYLLVAGAAGIIFLSNRSARSLPGRFFGGLWNLYGSIGATVGDIASYMRLYALGLATFLIADVVNRMGVMVLQGIPVAGVVLMLAIIVGGHVFNFAINLVGAFVHPLRLQYVEFFGKFYEDGGRPFEPLGIRLKKTVIDKAGGI